MQARLKAGWVTEADLAPPAAERSLAGRERKPDAPAERDRRDGA